MSFYNTEYRGVPGGSGVKTPHGLTPGQGTKILQAERHGQKQKQDTIHGCKLEVEAVVFSYRLHLIKKFLFPQNGLRVSQVALVVRNLPASTGDSRDGQFDLWVRKIPWSKKWKLAPGFLPGKFHGQRSLGGYTVHEVAKGWTQLNN